MHPLDDQSLLTAPRRPAEPNEDEMRAEARWVMFRRSAKALAVLAGLIAFVGIGYLVVLVRDTQVDSTNRGKDTNRTAVRIEACTTPGRSCYERGQRQLTTAVVDVTRVSVLAAACASGAERRTVAEIQRCVLKGLNDPNAAVPRASGLPSAVSPAPSASPSSAPTSSPRSSASSSTPRPQTSPSSAPTSAPASPRPTPRPPSPAPTPTPSLLCVVSPLLNVCL